MKLTPRIHTAVGIAIGAVWVFHGLYSKLLHGVPRHRMIVARVLGEGVAGPATVAIGVLEVALGVWVFSGRKRRACALTQTLAIVGMNALEILLARDLLISAPGMVILNAAFLALVWWWAVARPRL
jgi:hypothetical protein